MKINIMKSLGFTLVDVLLALAIIAVISGLTIPNLINYSQEQASLNQFRKVYTTLSQAYTRAAMENSSMGDTWSATEAKNYLQPYLNIAKTCLGWECNNPEGIKSLDGKTSYSGHAYQCVLADGTTLAFYIDTYLEVQFDLNGKKPPNQHGYDVFVLDLTTKNNSPIVGWAWYMSGNNWPNDSSAYCNKGYTGTEWTRGITCSYWILKHWNMDYLHRNISNAEWVGN